MIELNTVAVIVAIVFAALGIIWRNRSDIEAAKADLKSDMTEMKTDIKADMIEINADMKAIDECQRRMESDISFIKGALAVAIPGFKEGMESLVAEASEEERVSEVVGD